MTLLAAEGLIVRRAARAIVNDVSLRLEGGQFVALLGPNGAGKSTLMLALAGLLAPTSGQITLDGVALGRLDRRALARRRAYLPQQARAEWPVSVERLVALGLLPQLPAFGPVPPALAARVRTMLETVDLVSRRDQPATTLSGGELARAMLGRALVGEPDVLIVDEPFAGLDPRHALDGIARLRALADAGTLVIAALHDLTLAARHASHVAVMRDGRLIASGTTARTLTATLIRNAFDVTAKVTDAGTAKALVDVAGG